MMRRFLRTPVAKMRRHHSKLDSTMNLNKNIANRIFLESYTERFGNELFKPTHIKSPARTHSLSMQGDSVKRPKSCAAFHVSCRVKTPVAAAGYCVG